MSPSVIAYIIKIEQCAHVIGPATVNIYKFQLSPVIPFRFRFALALRCSYCLQQGCRPIWKIPHIYSSQRRIRLVFFALRCGLHCTDGERGPYSGVIQRSTVAVRFLFVMEQSRGTASQPPTSLFPSPAPSPLETLCTFLYSCSIARCISKSA